MKRQDIVLASTSPFRKALLKKLNLTFDCAKPYTDETALEGETAQELVERLAINKAKAVTNQYPNALIIGSDQVALADNKIIGKPHTIENAINQLSSFSGKCITFYTGLCVYNSNNQITKSLVEPFKVHFKSLTAQEIKNYVHKELPLNCAGSFKSEGLGICLFSKLEGDDPNSLIGLPLIKLVQLFSAHNFDVLANQE